MELLVVIFIIGVFMAYALPMYVSSLREARVAVANGNAKAIALAWQTIYVKYGAPGYSRVPTADVARQLDGWPRNPCSDQTGQNAWSITTTLNGFRIVPHDSNGCVQLQTYELGVL